MNDFNNNQKNVIAGQQVVKVVWKDMTAYREALSEPLFIIIYL